MRITAVRAHLLTYVLEEPLRMPFVLGWRTVVKRDALIIEVATDEGLTGWGSSDPGEMGNRDWRPSDTARLIEERIGATLLGLDPAAREALWQRAAAASGVAEPQLTQAFGGIDMALWDIAGKRAGKPVCELLGRRRERVRAYASAGMYQPAEGYLAEARELAAAGFTAYKMRPAAGPEEDLATIRALRHALPDLELLVDAHSWWRAAPDIYTEQRIFELARALDALGLYWLEDPLDYRRLDPYRRLTQELRTRVATGENEQGQDDLRRLVDQRACDVLIADGRLHGGITGAMAMARHANAAGIAYAAHNFSDMVAQAASAQVMLAVEDAALFEYPTYRCPRWRGMYDNALVTGLTDQEIVFADGFVTVPDRPGLGVEPLPDFRERFPYREGHWTYWESPDGRLLAAQ